MLSPSARARFQEHAAYLAAHEPGLSLNVDHHARAATITGWTEVTAGGVAHRFGVEIRYSGLDPFTTPDTYDPSGRFPPRGERHVEPDSRFCMWLPQTDPGDFRTPDGLALHLHRVKQFLALQLMYEVRRRLNITPRWPGDEWAHGVDGHVEWVHEQIARYPPCDLKLFRRDIAGGRRATSPDARCPCRSGKTFRSCHRPLTETLKKAKKDMTANLAIARVLRESA